MSLELWLEQASDLPHHNWRNVATVQMMHDLLGAKMIYHLEIPDHRVPSINQMNSTKLKEKIRMKKQERRLFMQAHDSASSLQATELS